MKNCMKQEVHSSGVTVIIVRDYSARYMQRLLSSFCEQNSHHPLEFIIVERNPYNAATAVIEKFYSRIHFLTLEVKPSLTWTACANLATLRAVYPNLLFLDETVVFSSDVLTRALKVLADPFIGVVGMRIKDYPADILADRQPAIRHAGVAFQWNEVASTYQPYIIATGSPTDPETTRSGFYPAVSGTFLLCRLDDFNAIGGFCERYRGVYWDIDFCLSQAITLGKKCFCINDLSLFFTADPAPLRREERCEEVEALAMFTGHDEELFRERMAESTALIASTRTTQTQAGAVVDGSSLPLRVLFVAHSPLDSNSGYHIENLAAGLSNLGVECAVAVPRENDLSPVDRCKAFPVFTYASLLEEGTPFADGQPPTLIYAWTPREVVRLFAHSLKERYTCPVVIHLEDNEDYLTSANLGCGLDDLKTMSLAELDKNVPWFRYHPVHGRSWLEDVQGLTMVTDTLQVYNYGGVETLTLFPPPDERLYYPRPLNFDLRRQLNIPADHTVFAYTGNTHEGNSEEVFALYEAVRLLNENNCPATLIRTGKNQRNFLANQSTKINALVKHLGWVRRETLPEVLAAADILVQPGLSGVFNDFRIPCKLSEYFAIGRPVILPATNLGLRVEHGREAYVLASADAVSITAAALAIKNDRRLYNTLAAGAVDFYLAQISRPLYVQELYLFLQGIMLMR